MMAFIINSLLKSNIKEEIAIKGKKQINTWRLVIYNMRRLTNHMSVTRNLMTWKRIGLMLLVIHNHVIKSSFADLIQLNKSCNCFWILRYNLLSL